MDFLDVINATTAAAINATTAAAINATTTAPVEPTTAAPSPESIPELWGFIAAAVAVILFGSNFVPVKKFETGDGMFFQWVLCLSIWTVGLVIQCIRNFPPFYPLAMLGGFLWSTGNITVVPIIKTIGLGKGILVWGSFNLLAGWTTGRFGLFGLHKEVPAHVVLNYVGMGLCLISAVVYIFVQSRSETSVNGNIGVRSFPTEQDPLLPRPSQVESGVNVQMTPPSRLEVLSPYMRNVLGTLLAIFAGVLYGLNFTPVIYIQDNYEGASKDGLDYVFAHFSGILLTSTVYFALYCMCMKNKPCLYPQAILPSLLSGVMWAIADASWFIANSALSEAVSFPIITSGPGIIGAMWGILMFKEIQGKRNILLVILAASFTIAGAVLTGFSKG
ncbi:hypothetical protein CAPTEDRAFT_3325 [Capitella teleta]|uniref:Transmembrane protein 144 n=1 Tax=Capitella teleta TaxID=283909 RepID=R7TJK6_CAPTE|nr:hypothetical protein CAPTEDRAFT_3325 [Capitella teleta]|eukprot:ELT94008.1 hypothetical protein CAPTEDRAFT_3325 [Capitella teleta]